MCDYCNEIDEAFDYIIKGKRFCDKECMIRYLFDKIDELENKISKY